ncbi:MAG: leucyl-tRNA synthetase [Gaiellaceae bacterium]|nr:leucyl-tRNA synthetase [Gaiellaceae bacterium]
MDTYDPQAIEQKWQRVWEDARAFYVDNPPPGTTANGEFYMLEMLPYPSGHLHMGHVLNYTLGDVVTHFQRRNGLRVLRPMGYDSFGLPAENAAIKEGGHPREIVEANIANIERQMRRLGWAIDWDRVIAAHDPAYYRWTQWLFLRFLEQGLAYRKEAPVNWCPNDQTVLANEQVVDGKCERCGAVVEARKMEQWFFRITAYADALLDDHELIDWPERTKTIQRNWIGRSEGAELLFRIDELDVDVPVFTTRPDTVFGATFFALAPEHPLVDTMVERSPNGDEIRQYVRGSMAKRVEERATDEKSGVFTGFFATNPATDARVPVWVADYVLMEYGTGALMAVPGHDERDEAFAERFELPVKQVIDEEQGVLVDSAQFSGMPADEAGPAIVEWLGERGRGRPAVSFRLRDWGFSRQRYWGAPIPVVYCGECGIVPVPDDELPVILPEVEDYRPKGKPPLASNEEWLRVPCPRCGGEGTREAETMDTFVDSAWYFLRYCDPDNDQEPFARRLADFWAPIAQYIGGIDHATGHLMYSRFFVKVMNELGLVGFREPFQRLFHQGWVRQGGTKMSKSRGNVTAPDELAEMYGADAVRLYILFVGPADQDMDWTEEGVEGIARFLRRLWRIVHEAAAGDGAAPDGAPLVRKAHETIARVGDDIGRRFVFNTPIAAVMELINELGRNPSAPGARFAAETAVSLIQPYAPHIAEELWEALGRSRLWEEQWPVADESQLRRETFELVIQVNGRVRDRIEASAEESEDELVARAKASERVQAQLDGKEIRQAIVVPGKLVNLVV